MFEEKIKKITENISDILSKKNTGYGNAFYDGMDEIKKLFTPILEQHHFFKYIHYIGFFQREYDKLKRFINLLPADIPETERKKRLYDAVLDIAGYAILFLNYLEEEDGSQ